MPQPTLSAQVDMLRVQIETSVMTPMILVISSALQDDGKAVVASELAKSLVEAGYSTLFVREDEQTYGGAGSPKPLSLNEITRIGLDSQHMLATTPKLTIANLRTAVESEKASKVAVAAFCEACRGSFAVTIVEAIPGLKSSFSMLTSVAADGIMIAAKEGRRVCDQDRELSKTVEHNRMPFLGVVSVAKAVIRETSNQPVKRDKRANAPSMSGDRAPSREEQRV